MHMITQVVAVLQSFNCQRWDYTVRDKKIQCTSLFHYVCFNCYIYYLKVLLLLMFDPQNINLQEILDLSLIHPPNRHVFYNCFNTHIYKYSLSHISGSTIFFPFRNSTISNFSPQNSFSLFW